MKPTASAARTLWTATLLLSPIGIAAVIRRLLQLIAPAPPAFRDVAGARRPFRESSVAHHAPHHSRQALHGARPGPVRSQPRAPQTGASPLDGTRLPRFGPGYRRDGCCDESANRHRRPQRGSGGHAIRHHLSLLSGESVSLHPPRKGCLQREWMIRASAIGLSRRHHRAHCGNILRHEPRHTPHASRLLPHGFLARFYDPDHRGQGLDQLDANR